MNGEVEIPTANCRWLSFYSFENVSATHIVEPVAAATDGDTLCTHAEREHLAHDDPSNWAPRLRSCNQLDSLVVESVQRNTYVAEVDSVEPDKDNGSPAGTDM